MKSLEQEAEEYAEKENAGQKGQFFDFAKLDFIAGANSKWVQAEKIKAQIEILTGLYENSYIKSGREFWKKKFEELEQKLKQLEDETLQ